MTARHPVARFLLSLVRLREFGLVLVLLLLLVLMARLSPDFLEPYNLFDMTRPVTEIGIMACAMTFVIITGGIDLSVASAMAMAGIFMGWAYAAWGLPLWALIIVALAAGAAGGLLNGLLVAFAGIPPLIVTLATWAAFRGVGMAVTRGQPFSELPDSMLDLGFKYYFPTSAYPQGLVPVQLFVLIAVAAFSAVLLHRTTLGRYVYAVGNSETAARFAAVPVRRVKVAVYAMSGLSAGLAAVILTARSFTARADAAEGYELDVIACVVLGGTSIMGGRGTMLGTILGLAIIMVLRRGLGLAGISGKLQPFFLGTVLILTAVLNEAVERRRRKAG